MSEMIFAMLASDNPGMMILVIVAAAVFLGAAIYGSWRRNKALREWAASRGLVFHPGKDRYFDGQYGQFSCFRRGHSRYARNVITGCWEGNEAIFFDYHYTTGSGKNQSHRSFSGVLIFSPLAMRPLHIRPESVFDKVTEFFGLDDIDFESAEFSRKFYVKSPDRKWAFDVLHARAMEFLLSRPRHTIEFQPGVVLVKKSGTFKPPAFEQAADLAAGLLNMIPEYVKEGG